MPDEYSTIQSAIDAASDGDIVLVSADIYYENINFDGKNIKLQSHFCYDEVPDSSHLINTIIDGSSVGSVITFNSGEGNEATLCGFTITNGMSMYGAGIYMDRASPIIEHNLIINNSYTESDSGRGAGIYKKKGRNDIPSIIRNNRIASNNVDSGFGGGIYLFLTNTILENNSIHNNYAKEGGGIYLIQSNPYIINCDISNNEVSYRAAAIYFSRSDAKLINCHIENNFTDQTTGTSTMSHVFYVWCSCPDIIKSTIINENSGADNIYNSYFSCNEDDVNDPLAEHFISCAEVNSTYWDISIGGSVSNSYGPYYVNMNYSYYTECSNPYIHCDVYSGNLPNFVDAGDPDLPTDPDNTITDIGFMDNFTWDWEDIWSIHYNHLEILIYESYLRMPGYLSLDYKEPTIADRNIWSSIIINIINGNYSDAESQLVDYNYSLIYNNNDYNGYIIIKENYPIQKGWGTFVHNPSPSLDLQIHNNHPIFDFNTPLLAIDLFEELNAEWFFMAGTHRYANCENDLDNDVFGNGVREDPCDDCPSDMGRNQNSIFETIFETILDNDPCDYVLSIHAFSDSGHDEPAQKINLSHGTTVYDDNTQIVNSGILADYCDEIISNPSTECCFANSSHVCDDLSGSKNPQGLYVNSKYPGHWIQVEIASNITPMENAYSNFIYSTDVFFNDNMHLDENCYGCIDEASANYNPSANSDEYNECLESIGTDCEIGFCLPIGYGAGDMNDDGQLNILDVVMLANIILSGIFDERGDLNCDGLNNILDIIILVNAVLSI